ncbi:phage tail protein [Xenorhabdus innexi]|uniref:Phage tail protein n=1 Tax=Xenorhabdus innexi TaxID=290109 RepID=A0A1N6MS83_9GAMM|nr:phage tail protein [Xenorhabdus innexi]PHM38588.1 phage tail protein [Xenorhabdus innexi]SIP71599.1 hypothetical protein XIS1_1210009 [Xenorhabdus innexi]
MSKYFALLTRLGADRLANAAALGTKIEITHMAVGDGGGQLPTPDTNQTQLINEKRRAAINVLSIDPKNTNQIIAEQVIPEHDGGWWIREIGLFDKDGVLMAVANCAETYKPQLQEGSGRTQTIRMVLIVSHTNAVTLKIDPSVVLATREYADAVVANAISEHEKSRRHPDATLTEKGVVVLSNAVDSGSETQAATPKAVKAAYDFANTANTQAYNRLEKAQNGADIPDKSAFVKNLGFIAQQTGYSATTVMSQRGATTAFALKHSKEAFKSGNHTIVSDDEYAYAELINNTGWRLSLETLPENKAFSGNIILRNAGGDVVSVIKIPRQADTTFATLADLTGYQPAGHYATKTAVNGKLDKSAVVQTPGTSTESVMSQEGATKAFVLRHSKEAFKSGNHTIVSDDEYAYAELINNTGWRLSLETLPENETSSGNIILRNAGGDVVSVIKIPRQANTTFATLADLAGYQPTGHYATQTALSDVEKKSVQAFRYGWVRTIKTAVNHWTPAAEGEFIIGIKTSFDGAGTWIITEVKVATLQTFTDGKWVNIQNA